MKQSCSLLGRKSNIGVKHRVKKEMGALEKDRTHPSIDAGFWKGIALKCPLLSSEVTSQKVARELQ